MSHEEVVIVTTIFNDKTYRPIVYYTF